MMDNNLNSWLLNHFDPKTGTLDLRLGFMNNGDTPYVNPNLAATNTPEPATPAPVIADTTNLTAQPGHGGGGGFGGGGGGHSFGGGGGFGGGHSSYGGGGGFSSHSSYGGGGGYSSHSSYGGGGGYSSHSSSGTAAHHHTSSSSGSSAPSSGGGYVPSASSSSASHSLGSGVSHSAPGSASAHHDAPHAGAEHHDAPHAGGEHHDAPHAGGEHHDAPHAGGEHHGPRPGGDHHFGGDHGHSWGHHGHNNCYGFSGGYAYPFYPWLFWTPFPFFYPFAYPYSYAYATNMDPYYSNLPEDPAYGQYIPQLMANPTPILNQLHVKTLILGNLKGKWDPKSQLAALLSNPELEAVDLTNNGLDDADAAMVFANKHLKKVELAYNNITNVVIDSTALESVGLQFNKLAGVTVTNNSALQTLNLGDNVIADITLTNNPVLQTLNLEDNKLTPECGVKVAENKSSIVNLNVNNNNIGDEGAAALKEAPKLQTLFAHANGINAEGAKGIATIPSLKTLDISNNPIKNEGGVPIAQNQNLRDVSFKNTKIGCKTVSALVKNKELTSAKTTFCDVGPVNKFRIWSVVHKNKKAEQTPPAEQQMSPAPGK